jgi:hypothetical protein
MDVETALKRIEDAAAMLREMANHAARGDQALSPESLSGIGDSCMLMQQLAQGARTALTADALNRPVRFTE